MSAVILCDSHFQPLREIGLEHAVHLLVSGKAAPAVGLDSQKPVARLGLAPSAVGNWGARFPELIVDGHFLVPGVLRLHRAVAFRLGQRRPTRALVLRRDRHRCQYCGKRGGALTLDHVMPQSRGGKDTWENLVAACPGCNHGKADRTPEEAGMKLIKRRRLAPDLYSEVLARMSAAFGQGA